MRTQSGLELWMKAISAILRTVSAGSLREQRAVYSLHEPSLGQWRKRWGWNWASGWSPSRDKMLSRILLWPKKPLTTLTAITATQKTSEFTFSYHIHCWVGYPLKGRKTEVVVWSTWGEVRPWRATRCYSFNLCSLASCSRNTRITFYSWNLKVQKNVCWPIPVDPYAEFWFLFMVFHQYQWYVSISSRRPIPVLTVEASLPVYLSWNVGQCSMFFFVFVFL